MWCNIGRQVVGYLPLDPDLANQTSLCLVQMAMETNFLSVQQANMVLYFDGEWRCAVGVCCDPAL